MDQSSDLCGWHVSFISAQGEQCCGRDGSVGIFMFPAASPFFFFFFCTTAPYVVPSADLSGDDACFVAVRTDAVEVD